MGLKEFEEKMNGRENKRKTIKEFKDCQKFDPRVTILINDIHKNNLQKIDIDRKKQIIAMMEPRGENKSKKITAKSII